MQPQSPALVQHSGTDPLYATEASSTIQHGDEGVSTPSSPPLLPEHREVPGGVSLQQDHDDGKPALQSRTKSPSPLSSPTQFPQSTPYGLSHSHTPVSQSRNRIAEYENASQSSTPRRRVEGPAFEVIKKSRKPGDKRSPIAELPNGAP